MTLGYLYFNISISSLLFLYIWIKKVKKKILDWSVCFTWQLTKIFITSLTGLYLAKVFELIKNIHYCAVLLKNVFFFRSTIWSEKEIIEESAWEFAETDKMLKAAEDLCGPYVWGIYDLLVLPSSFAYGGMENPCLTFVTPTCLVWTNN